MSQLKKSNRKLLQRIAWFLIVLMINQIAFPVAALALTSGPSQPEYSSFSPAGSTEMVNLFSGNFSYNIPLLEVPGSNGGYPINLFYNSVSTPDEESSWTGLGWNVNIGALSRAMRGLPDDFNGEVVSRKLDMRPQETTTVGFVTSGEVAGWDAGKAGLEFGVNYVYNNYKGPGMSIDLSTHLSINNGVSLGAFGFSPSFSLGMSVSSIDAASVNVGIGSVGVGAGPVSAGVGLGIHANALSGLDYSLNLSLRVTGRSSSSSVSFSKKTYTPQVTLPWTGESFLWNAHFMAGATYVYAKLGLKGSYHMARIINAGIPQGRSAYGTSYLQNADEHSIMDFNREKDGPVHRYNRYLANPIMTYDLFNLSGQGIGGTFRTHRSDYGVFREPKLESYFSGGSLGAEGGVAFALGLNVAGIFRFEGNNWWPNVSAASFKSESPGDDFEPAYYKMEGDIVAEDPTTYNYVGKNTARDKPLRIKRGGFGIESSLGGEFMGEKDINGNPNTGTYETKLRLGGGAGADQTYRENRKPRNTSIQPITNKELRDDNGNEVVALPEYDVKYYSAINTYDAAPTNDVVRPNNDQNAGFTVLGRDGVRWVYGLPVLNHETKEAKFSVAPLNTCSKRVDILQDGDRNSIKYKASIEGQLRSNDFIDEQSVPSHVHTHLLTTVLGSDYRDVDGQLGPTDGDVGYWMKTNYVKLSDSYQWRAPFSGANYIQGLENNVMDDLGMLNWGEREVYLPASIETNTHIAFFDVSKRYDARGAKHYIQNSTDAPSDLFGEYSYKLDKIRLYSKTDIDANGQVVANATPLKTAHFKYDYSLCPNQDNYNATGAGPTTDLYGSSPILGGKLTLKEVYFTFEKNSKGSLSPYQFLYNNHNPEYNDAKIDRWGMYRESYLNPSATANYTDCDNVYMPYVNQQSDSISKASLDLDANAWHLEKIIMPSGSVMNIQLERDDYAYVQDAVAARMFKIESVADTHDDYNTNNNLNDDKVLETQELSGQENRQIKFKLETPIDVSDAKKQEKLNAYIEDLPIVSRYGEDHKQIYYRIRVNLRNTENPDSEVWEYVPGYAEIEKDGAGDEIHFGTSDINSDNEYTHAYITLRGSRIQLASTGQRFHPMAMTSWKYLRDNLATKFLEVDLGGPPNANSSLSQMTENIDALFKGYYNYAYQKGYAKEVDLDRSFIRLNSPDKTQYGGGARVKQISIEDGWNPNSTTEETSTLGVVYEYTTEDASGNTISSGVVENEPFVGYDECALRWAEVLNEEKNFVIHEVHKYEHPINEGYHPGSVVGYSNVKVRSLASNYAYAESKGQTIPSDLQNKAFGTSGQTEYEFYTAKDFPVRTSKTSLDDTETNPWAMALLQLVSMSRIDHYTGTQGYCIELNNMHGKTKRVSSYAQLHTGEIESKPYKKVEYTYKSKEVTETRRGQRNTTINVLDNMVKALVSDDPEAAASTEDRIMGVDYDFFLDGREAIKTGGTMGVDLNVTYTPLFIFGFFPWPRYDLYENRARTSVTNKIIKRTAILEKVDAFDGQSQITTKNLVFDAQTGSPVLTIVDNQMGGDIYNYGVPTHFAHNRMGAANQNAGISYIFAFNQNRDACTGYYGFNTAFPGTITSSTDLLIEGDEFTITLSYDNSNKYKAIYMGELLNSNGIAEPQFDIIDAPAPTGVFFGTLKTTRSGNRNLLGGSIAQYSTIDTDGNLSNANPLTDRKLATVTWTPQIHHIDVPGTGQVGSATLSPATGQGTVSPALIDNVLSLSAAEFSDEWTLEDYDYCSNMSTNDLNPYISGEKGVWRAKGSFSYVADREQFGLTQATAEVDIRKSGVLNDVPMFNWMNPMFEYTNESNWVRGSDVRKYHMGGQAVETTDILGNNQTVVYGYNDHLVTAQGVNSKHYELGFEGFEEFTPSTIGDDLGIMATQGARNNGHIDIYPVPTNCSISTITRHENHRLLYPMRKPSVGTSGIAHVIVQKKYDSVLPSNTKATLHLRNENNQQTVSCSVTAKYPLDANYQEYKVPGVTYLINDETESKYTVYELNFGTNCPDVLDTDLYWFGDITLLYDVPIQPAHPSVGNDYVTNEEAHTGKYSLRIDKTETSVYNHEHTFYQNTLRLEKGKEYVVSTWIKVNKLDTRDIEPFATYADGVNRSISFCGTAFYPTGPIIEGWQRIEGTVKYLGGSQNLVIKDNTSVQNYLMFVDDIRIFPAAGNMVSFVYDIIDYKLKATLDRNNYATFYIYDEAGVLISSKQETERGIVTVQESRSHIDNN